MKLIDRVSEKVDINGHQIKFTLKSARKDIRHLVVLLNGYRHGGWEYGNSIDFIKCHVLMIEDVFEGGQSCYLGKNQNFDFADRVAALIDKTLFDLGLSKANCTLLGPSKGGFAALYIGMKYGYKNIVAPAFVGHIGTWMVVDKYEKIIQHVMGSDNADVVRKYDSLLTDLIANGAAVDKNIYIFISHRDRFYLNYGQKEVIDSLIKKCTNFNLFITDSQLAFQHDQVTPYYLQETLSTVALLAQGITIRLPESVYENQTIQMKASPSTVDVEFFKTRTPLNKEQAVNKITKIEIKEHIFYIEGLAFILNYDSPNHSFLSKKLCIENIETGHQHSYIVGTVPNHLQSRLLFLNSYYDYAASGMATMGHKGIEIQDLPNGQYKLGISITKTAQELSIKDLNLSNQLSAQSKLEKSKKSVLTKIKSLKLVKNFITGKLDTPLTKTEQALDVQDLNPSTTIDKKYNCGETEYRICQKEVSVYLTKRPVIGRLISDQDCFFSIEKFWHKNDLYHLEGILIVPGVDMPVFHLGNYYVIAQHKDSGKIYSHGLGQVRDNTLSKKVDNPYGGYDACYFATMGFKGVDAQSYDAGEYTIYISLSYRSEIFTYQTKKTLLKKDNGVYWA